MVFAMDFVFTHCAYEKMKVLILGDSMYSERKNCDENGFAPEILKDVLKLGPQCGRVCNGSSQHASYYCKKSSTAL